MAKKKTSKKEALTTRYFITEVLEKELNIPPRNIVNDTTFAKFTGNLRPDLLISEIPYDIKAGNETEYINSLVGYAEVKDTTCCVDDINWKDAIKQGIVKSKKLNMPYFMVTNLKTTYYYNTATKKELSLNGNPLREFCNLDILKFIKNFLLAEPSSSDITVNSDTATILSEDVFNKKLWELANVYREINFKDSSDKIDFTIGFIILKYYEEKIIALNETKNPNSSYWSDLNKYIDDKQFITILVSEFEELQKDSQFNEMNKIINTVLSIITAKDGNNEYINKKNILEIYHIVESMGKLHASGFDLFGSVYEKFASTEEKKAFGEFFTRRHYTHVFSKLLVKNMLTKINDKTDIKILDPACGTGGFLTEVFKVIYKRIEDKYSTNNPDSAIGKDTLSTKNTLLNNLKKNWIHGYDVKEENVARTKLNMFLVGDGHTNIIRKNSLKDIKVFDYLEVIDEQGKKKSERTFLLTDENKFDYIITNPPYGSGTELADTNSSNTSRFEIAFIFKIIHLLKTDGEACLIIPDGFFENPSYSKLRKELLEICEVNAVVSLPKHAFAPYTLEKTYALYIKKKNSNSTKIDQDKIWMYIIDNDGYANSNKRFPTKLKDLTTGSWLHDEINSYIDSNGVQQNGLLEQRWLTYDDQQNKTSYINEKGQNVLVRKAGFISVNQNTSDSVSEKNYWNLLPEYYLRPYEPHYITIEDFEKEVNKIIGGDDAEN